MCNHGQGLGVHWSLTKGATAAPPPKSCLRESSEEIWDFMWSILILKGHLAFHFEILWEPKKTYLQAQYGHGLAVCDLRTRYSEVTLRHRRKVKR